MMKNEYDDDEYDEFQMILIDYLLFEFVYVLNQLKNEMMMMI
jgi:hypothetical protein